MRKHADYINRMEMLFTINPRPHPSMYDNTNVESFSSLPIPIQDSDPHQEEIDVVSVTDDVLPPRIDNDDSDGEVDVVDDLRHSFNMGYEHFNTNLVTNDVAKSSTKNLVPIPREREVVSENESKSIKPVKDNSLVFTTISNPLFDDNKINSDELNSYIESNFVESTSNHDTVKIDNLDEFSRPF
nr:hypothetical protein [Tanacetum cinerariifolium]